MTDPPAPTPEPRRRVARRVGRGVATGVRVSTRGVTRAGRYGIRLLSAGTRTGTRRFRSYAASQGADATGLARLTELLVVASAGDAAVTVGLAGTVFALPSGEARNRVALFLLLTMAPFALLAPLIGPLLDRYPHGRRWSLGVTLAIRAFLAWQLAGIVTGSSEWLFPSALGCLVASKAFAVTKAAALPRLLPTNVSLVQANARLAVATLLGVTLGGGAAGLLGRIGAPWSLRGAFLILVLATVMSVRLPAWVDAPMPEPRPAASATRRAPFGRDTLRDGIRRGLAALPRAVRHGLTTTTGARLLTGFLTFFAAFLFRAHPVPGWNPTVTLGLVAGGAGLGNGLGSLVGNLLGHVRPQRISAALLVAATVAATLAAALWSIVTVVVLGFVAGLFGQLGKLAFDSTIQTHVPEERRSRVFSFAETWLQVAWVCGGAIGITLPLEPHLGFGLIALLLATRGLVAARDLHRPEAADVLTVRPTGPTGAPPPEPGVPSSGPSGR